MSYQLFPFEVGGGASTEVDIGVEKAGASTPLCEEA